ncbi:DUF3613 domain-containing protein [Variovorax sp. PDC80]|uniref:DUF3613 domain-containing protein n=1 Tax=Variovorax sp. PDC80 TaxID=1882827 RepID=UPI000B8A0A8B|nr:DUF3613 domain-containing protein [Variovorax sp. PDC80]
MTNNKSVNRVFALSASALATTLLLLATPACAQSASANPGQDGTAINSALATNEAAQSSRGPVMPPAKDDQGIASEKEEFYEPALQVGDATLNLLAWQSSGQISSATPRSIAGSVASRSYERYLKSFEYPIPERLGSTVKGPASGSGSTGSSAR